MRTVYIYVFFGVPSIIQHYWQNTNQKFLLHVRCLRSYVESTGPHLHRGVIICLPLYTNILSSDVVMPIVITISGHRMESFNDAQSTSACFSVGLIYSPIKQDHNEGYGSNVTVMVLWMLICRFVCGWVGLRTFKSFVCYYEPVPGYTPVLHKGKEEEQKQVATTDTELWWIS
jgi:hypothetical protein